MRSVGFLTVCPVVMLVFGSFSEGLGAFGSFTLEKYIQSYTDPAFAGIIVNTVIFTVGSAFVATVLALFLAYLNTRTNIPFKFLFRIISIIPMMIPHILFSVSWVLLLNPSNGLINLLLREILHLKASPFNIYTLQGMILVEGAAGSAHRLSDHRPRHGRLRRLPGGIFQGLRCVEPADAAQSDAAGAQARHSGLLHSGHRPQPGIFCRSLRDRHAGTDLRAGNAYLPDHRDRFRRGLRHGGGGGHERPGHLHHAHLPLSLPDLGERKIRNDLQQGLQTRRDRSEEMPNIPFSESLVFFPSS